MLPPEVFYFLNVLGIAVAVCVAPFLLPALFRVVNSVIRCGINLFR